MEDIGPRHSSLPMFGCTVVDDWKSDDPCREMEDVSIDDLDDDRVTRNVGAVIRVATNEAGGGNWRQGLSLGDTSINCGIFLLLSDSTSIV